MKNQDQTTHYFYGYFADIVNDIRVAAEIRGQVCDELTQPGKASMAFRRNLVTIIEDIKLGAVFTEQNIRCIRPGYRIPPRYYPLIYGMQAIKYISCGTLIGFGMGRDSLT